MNICMRPGRAFRKGAALLAVLVVLALAFPAETARAEADDWPELNSAGYLDEGEYVYENPEAGLWRYCSETLKVEIIRYTQTEPIAEIWYEAEVRSRKEIFGFVTAVQGEHFRKVDWPQNVCSLRGAVLAINGDYASNRWGNMRYKKERYKVGILVRDGEIQNTETKKSGNTSFPNLDTLAIYPDGNMEVHDSRELTAEEYVEKGAIHVLAFGPWLIRDGELNPQLSKFGKSRAQRTAIGMVEPGHYYAMMVEGRQKTSKGGELTFLAEKLLERGCVTGFNLDGGETSCILFMGKQINKVGNAHNSKGFARKGAEFLSIGISALVEGYNPDAP